MRATGVRPTSKLAPPSGEGHALSHSSEAHRLGANTRVRESWWPSRLSIVPVRHTCTGRPPDRALRVEAPIPAAGDGDEPYRQHDEHDPSERGNHPALTVGMRSTGRRDEP